MSNDLVDILPCPEPYTDQEISELMKAPISASEEQDALEAGFNMKEQYAEY